MLLLLFILLILPLECLVRLTAHLAQPSSAHDQYTESKYSVAAGEPDKAYPYIFLLGDSVMDNDAYADYLEVLLQEKGIKRSVMNLAVPGTTTLDIGQLLLQTATVKGHRPAMVIVSASWYFLIGSRRAKEFTENNYLGQCMLQQPDNLIDSLSCGLSKYSYLYRYRGALKAVLKHAPQALMKPESKPVIELNRYGASPRGWQPLHPIHPKDFQYQPQLTASKINSGEGSLARLVEYCKAQNIPVLLVQMPEWRHPDYSQSYQEAARAAGILYLNLREEINHEHYFFDDRHLNTAGSVIFTEKLAHRLDQPPYKEVLEAGMK